MRRAAGLAFLLFSAAGCEADSFYCHESEYLREPWRECQPARVRATAVVPNNGSGWTLKRCEVNESAGGKIACAERTTAFCFDSRRKVGDTLIPVCLVGLEDCQRRRDAYEASGAVLNKDCLELTKAQFDRALRSEWPPSKP